MNLRHLRIALLLAAAIVWLMTVPAMAFPQAGPQTPPPASQDPAAQKPAPLRIVQRPAYQPNAANEDWSALKDPATRTDRWDWAKVHLVRRRPVHDPVGRNPHPP